MDDPQLTPGPDLPEPSHDATPAPERSPAADPQYQYPEVLPAHGWAETQMRPRNDEASTDRKRGFRRNLYLLLGLALAAFVLTSWILVRLDTPFGVFASGPQEVVRAQLRALDLGELKPAYDMFSARYRAQVSFDAWHELCVVHWQMFHANVIRAGAPEPSGASILLEVYLRGADATNYRARFTVIRAAGRWWIDDVHWAQEPSAREVWRS